MDNYCHLHERQDCTLCDECGHESALHLNAHNITDPERRALAFANATCWSESICSACVAGKR